MEFVYVKPVEGHLVPRYTTVAMDSPTYIGATRKGKVITWNLDAVVRISVEEWTRYGREYRRALSAGSLTKVDESVYIEWVKKQDEASEAAANPPPVEAPVDEKIVEVPVEPTEQEEVPEAKPVEAAKKPKKTTSEGAK